MAPLCALILATAYVASAAGSDTEEAILVQVSFNRTHLERYDCDCCGDRWDDTDPDFTYGDFCCAYCLDDKGHSKKRVCVTRTKLEHDDRPFCDTCGGAYNPGWCNGHEPEHDAHCAWRC
mmetsp:Transcript_57960/g.116183  ORF Transcript_57960/g.116183 Transcript_57960/m.116183 type:complete len:120 (-) Transcript_57960:80-439(-)